MKCLYELPLLAPVVRTYLCLLFHHLHLMQNTDSVRAIIVSKPYENKNDARSRADLHGAVL